MAACIASSCNGNRRGKALFLPLMLLLLFARENAAPAGSCGLCNLLRQLRFNYKRATNCQAALTMTVASVRPLQMQPKESFDFVPRGWQMPRPVDRHSSIDNWNTPLMS